MCVCLLVVRVMVVRFASFYTPLLRHGDAEGLSTALTSLQEVLMGSRSKDVCAEGSTAEHLVYVLLVLLWLCGFCAAFAYVVPLHVFLLRLCVIGTVVMTGCCLLMSVAMHTC